MKVIALSLLKQLLKLFARLAVARYQPGIVGVTGNVGKTSTKEALRVVLGIDRRVRASSKSFNNELGLPLAILGDWDSTEGLRFWVRALLHALRQVSVGVANYPELIILEYGVDRPGDMRRLLGIVRPHVGIFTAMGTMPVHVEFFPSTEALVREKAKFVNQLPTTGFAILNIDDPAVAATRNQTRAHVVTFGFSSEADVRISTCSTRLDGNGAVVSFKLTYGGSAVPVRLPGVIGKGHAYAAAAAAATALVFGMNLVRIAQALERYEGPPGRLKVIPGIKGSILVDDTYNASPHALREALDTLGMLHAKRKIVVLGDMLELGTFTEEAHRAAGRQVGAVADYAVTVGERAKFIAESALAGGFPEKKLSSFTSVREAGLYLQRMLTAGDVALIKGSQSVRMERIVKEVMASPARAAELLVRQTPVWLSKPGLYDD